MMFQTIKDKVTQIWRATPRAIRSGWITAWVTFTGVLLTILTGLLPALAEAISTRNFEPFYDSLNLAAAAAVSAVTGFVSGIVNAIYRWLRPIADSYKTAPPADPPADRGAIDAKGALWWFVVICVAIILVWFIATRVIDFEDEEGIRALLMS
jgi:ABC-type Fe3+ transport system permease subunit